MELVKEQLKRPASAGYPMPPEGKERTNWDLDCSIFNHRKTLESSFDSLFGNNQEENKIQKARAILGETVNDVPDDELATYLTQFQYLLDEWLDGFEKQVFNGLTLQQLLQER
ncbi:MAG TPA: hypothetical protein PK263_01860 [bacterium]|nr:hypothetical protein [bacterium]